jgi:hypothetical protein
MPYLSPEQNRANCWILPEITARICSIKGCSTKAAHQQIRDALADGRLWPLLWDPSPPPRNVCLDGITVESASPPRRHQHWRGVRVNWRLGRVLDDFDLSAEALAAGCAKWRTLLIRRTTPSHLWPDPEEIAEANARRFAREQEREKREFENPGWSKWRVYSWIAYRDRSLICRIDSRHNLGGLQFYAPPCVDRRPEETLLHALRADKLKAIDSNGKEIVADYWLGKEARDIGDVIFRRVDVLRVWPDPASALEPPAQSTESNQRKVDSTRSAPAFHCDYQADALGEGAKEPNTIPAVPLLTFVKDFIAREQKADRQPTEVRLEKAWHDTGRRGRRDELRSTFHKEMAAAGKEVNVGRPKNSPRNSP